MGLLSGRAADRIIRAVKTVEGERGHSKHGPADGNNILEPTWVRVTSGTVDANGNYPAIVTDYDPTTDTWVDYGACKLQAANGETLISGTRYDARCTGILDDELLYTTVSGSGAGATAFSGCKVFIGTTSGIQYLTGGSLLVPWQDEAWDTDGYHDNWNNPQQLVVPAEGWYEVGVHVRLGFGGVNCISYLTIIEGGTNIIAIDSRIYNDAIAGGTAVDQVADLLAVTRVKIPVSAIGTAYTVAVYNTSGITPLIDYAGPSNYRACFWIEKLGPVADATSSEVVLTGSGTWVATGTGTYTARVRVWSYGGNGANGAGGIGGGGGGGGAYSEADVTIIAGNSYSYTNAAGAAATFNTSSVVADYGRNAVGANGGAGGLAASGTGTIKFSGGLGETVAGDDGGGGGGAAGLTADGGDGSSSVGGLGGGGIGNGATGGIFGFGPNAQNNATTPGGGGAGGAKGGGLKSNGAAGKIVIELPFP